MSDHGGRISFFKTAVKIQCSIHRDCALFKASKALSINCGQMIAAWLYAGYQRFPDRSAAEQHKEMFQAQNRENALCSLLLFLCLHNTYTLLHSVFNLKHVTQHIVGSRSHLNIPGGHGLLMDDLQTW